MRCKPQVISVEIGVSFDEVDVVETEEIVNTNFSQWQDRKATLYALELGPLAESELAI